MNIQPVSLAIQTNRNNNKQKVAFGNFYSEITKEGIVDSIERIDMRVQKLSADDVKNLAEKIWADLEKLKQKYIDSPIDVHVFKDSESIWGVVKPGKTIIDERFLETPQKGGTKLFHELIISYGNDLIKKIDGHARELAEKYKSRTNA
ncbi:MAG: hypothetical protein WCY19_04800 [Candidatus Gastranaerophilaceae bacterium]